MSGSRRRLKEAVSCLIIASILTACAPEARGVEPQKGSNGPKETTSRVWDDYRQEWVVVPIVEPVFPGQQQAEYFEDTKEKEEIQIEVMGGAPAVKPVFIIPSPEPLVDVNNIAQLPDGQILQIEDQYGDSNYVSNKEYSLTSFLVGIKKGILWLLVHNTKEAGKRVSNLEINDTIKITEDGILRIYTVKEIRDYQALVPKSNTTDYVDLTSGQRLTPGDLIDTATSRGYPALIQTCITKEGDPYWGRRLIYLGPSD